MLERTIPEKVADSLISIPTDNPWYVGIWYSKDKIGKGSGPINPAADQISKLPYSSDAVEKAWSEF